MNQNNRSDKIIFYLRGYKMNSHFPIQSRNNFDTDFHSRVTAPPSCVLPLQGLIYPLNCHSRREPTLRDCTGSSSGSSAAKTDGIPCVSRQQEIQKLKGKLYSILLFSLTVGTSCVSF